MCAPDVTSRLGAGLDPQRMLNFSCPCICELVNPVPAILLQAWVGKPSTSPRMTNGVFPLRRISAGYGTRKQTPRSVKKPAKKKKIQQQLQVSMDEADTGFSGTEVYATLLYDTEEQHGMPRM